jgi:hypothetical protein
MGVVRRPALVANLFQFRLVAACAFALLVRVTALFRPAFTIR